MPGTSPRAPRSTSSAPRRRSRALVGLLAAPLLALTACGGSSGTTADEPAPSSAAGDFPVTVTGDNGQVTLEERPEDIVSMSATATEMLFAIGAGNQVEAADDNSNHPAEAPTTDLSAFTPNAEAIAGYDPDLVVLSNDTNGIVDALETLDVPVLLLEAATDLDDTYAQLELLGEATGHPEEAAEVVADVRDRIQAAVDSVPADAAGQRVFHELGPELYSADSSTFIGSIYGLFGLENIADGAADASGGYPQLSAEYVVDQAPDIIVLADTKCCAQTAETVAQRPGFGEVPAVVQGRVVEADDDVASRWGPRVADFAETVAGALQG
ncbi:ABC transporter substrate-binding protein [Blastococcus sp. MG754426]|uniref:ABC transporter substrate-binding protein n=1 Tax=unclassified Blastococcus TaxID=2619396 RepID=UPI001EF12EF7|nr:MULTISPECIES: ABC transporter substrate-binding protein [unclassified Blastococcus]MCF6509268.1 ABC transporter substrate-binding protein [Blastococcus sp. MG754426]MCF6512470.1 ABC transporter substrate-binding protein [Blastococcus sp. MG754427]